MKLGVLRKKTLFVVLLSLISTSLFAQDYVCEDSYNTLIKKAEKSAARKIAKTTANVVGGAGAWAMMVSEFGLEGAYLITVWSPGLAILALGVNATGGLYNLADTVPEKIQAKAVLDISKKTERELEDEDLKERLDSLVELINHRNSKLGLPALTQEQIDQISSTLVHNVRSKNVLDSFVHKVIKKGKNHNFTYEEVREKLVELASTTDQFCPQDSKGIRKPVTINKMIKITKEALIQK